MNEEITQRLVKYLDALEAGAVKGGEFIGEQAPEVCREIVAWHVASGVVNVSLCVVCLVAIWVVRWIVSVAVISADKDDKNHRAFTIATSLLFSGLISVAPIIGIYENGRPLLKAIYAPRLVIIEEIRKNIP